MLLFPYAVVHFNFHEARFLYFPGETLSALKSLDLGTRYHHEVLWQHGLSPIFKNKVRH